MDINKAIRKQSKSYKRFLLFNCFIFLLLPLILYFTKQFNIFLISYLTLIELLVLAAVTISISSNNLKFHYDGIKLRIRYGLRGKIIILCEKVVLVHIEKNEDIILLTKSKFRNDRMKEVSLKFLQSHPYVSYHYNRIKSKDPEELFYYIIIRKGGFLKYSLLDTLYKSCVYAVFTDEALEKIKQYRRK